MIPMGGRFSSPGLAACLVAGFALWFTRASLDVAGGPRGEVRVAMFPSWVELAGLVVLAAVVVLLGSMMLTRALRARGIRRTLPVAPLIPLFSLAWLAVPYLPWLPDVIPVLRVFAGPARFAFWAIVLGQVLWVTWQLARPEPHGATASARRVARQGAVVLVVSVVALGTAGRSTPEATSRTIS
jgi:hypothetical protein